MLAEILAGARRRLPDLLSQQDEILRRAAEQGPVRNLAEALTVPGLSIIAEVKRASPSRGPIDPALIPEQLAAQYEGGGAAAVSVLTEWDFFQGSLDDLRAAREKVSVPVLRKDFLLDAVQIWEARAAGADAVLLIVAALGDEALLRLVEETRTAGMEALVEVHTVEEVQRARAAGARLIGVNNRDLHSFRVDLRTAEDLARHLGEEVVRVAESGIHGPEDARRMRAAGYDAVLVGESLVRAGDRAGFLKSLRNGM